MNELETLCRPIIMRVCELRTFGRAGAVREIDEVAAEMKKELAEIKVKCAENATLAREFAHIEKPLAFFIDFSVREGSFEFSRSWRDIAREYGELSGDEKFFDILTSTLDDPNAKDRIEIFYLLMGLGFDGMYKREPDTVERKMKVCATRMPPMLDIMKEPVTETIDIVYTKPPRKNVLVSGPFVLAFSVLLAIAAFGFNYYAFYMEVNTFSKAITKTLSVATPRIESETGQIPGVDK